MDRDINYDVYLKYAEHLLLKYSQFILKWSISRAMAICQLVLIHNSQNNVMSGTSQITNTMTITTSFWKLSKARSDVKYDIAAVYT